MNAAPNWSSPLGGWLSVGGWLSEGLRRSLVPIGAAPGWPSVIARLAAAQTREVVLAAASVVTPPLSLARGRVEHTAEAPPSTPPPTASTPHPAVLVHGFAASQSRWSALAQALRARGMAVATLDYSPFGTSIEQLADRLADTARQLIDHTGSPKVHLVGHSLGGVIIAQALTDSRLAGRVDAVVTIGSPFGGSPWASLFPLGPIAQALRAGSPLLRRLATIPTPPGVRWLSFAATLDMIVPAARSTPANRQTEHITVDQAGHTGMLLDPQVINRIVTTLTKGEHLLAA